MRDNLRRFARKNERNGISGAGSVLLPIALLLAFVLLLLGSPFFSDRVASRAEIDHTGYSAEGSAFPIASGNYYLTQSIEISSPVSLANATVTLDLNGFDLVFTGAGKLTVGSESDAASLTILGSGEEKIVLSDALSLGSAENAIFVSPSGSLSISGVDFEVQKTMDRIALLKGASSFGDVSVSASAGVALNAAFASEGTDVSFTRVAIDAVGAYALVASGSNKKVSVGGFLTAPRGVRLGSGVTLVAKAALTSPIDVYPEAALTLSNGESVIVTSAETQEEFARNDLEKIVCLSEDGVFYLVEDGANAGQIAFQKDHVLSLFNGEELVSSVHKKRGQSVILASFAFPLTETHRQIGWSVVGDGRELALNAVYSEEADLSLSAIWERFIYSITYENVYGNNLNPDYYSVDDGLTLLEPERTGYSFVGWKSAPSDAPAKNRAIAPGETGDKHFIAVWEVEIYSIRYVGAENGVNAVTNSNPTSYSVESGEFSIETPTRTGYDFVRWEGYIAGEEPVIRENSTGDLVFTAVWMVTQYTITYRNAVNGVNGVTNSNPTRYSIESEAFTISAPSRRGFSFLNWTKGEDRIDRLEVPAGSMGDITLEANWDLFPVVAIYNSYTGVYDGASHETGAQVFHLLSDDLTARYEWHDMNGAPVVGLPDLVFSVRNVADSRVLKLYHEISYEDPSGNLYQTSGYVLDYFDKGGLTVRIDPAPLTVTPCGTLGKTYGEADGAIAYEVGAAIAEENPLLTGALSRESGERAGRYRITEGTLSLSSDAVSRNYRIQLASAFYEIGKKPLSVTALRSEIRYGDSRIVGRGVNYDGFVGGDTSDSLAGTLVYTSDYPHLGDVGSYALTPGGLTSSDYEIVFVPGVLDVLPKEIAVVWRGDRFVYDGEVKDVSAFAYAETGIGGGVLPLTVKEKEGKEIRSVGAYRLVAEKRDSNANYLLTNDETRIEITKMPLTIRAKDLVIEYGDAVDKFSVLFETFAGKDTIESLQGSLLLECDYSPMDEVAEYPISVSGVTAENYEITFVSGVLRVTKKKVTISVSAGGGLVGSVVPASASVDGALPGDVVRVNLVYEKDGVSSAEVPAEVGAYMVSASIEEDHYKADPVTLPFYVLRERIQSDPDKGPVAEIDVEGGVNPDSEFEITEIKDEKNEAYKKAVEYVSSRETVESVYDLTLSVSGEEIAVSSKMTVKIVIPTQLRYKRFSVLSVGDAAKTVSFRMVGDSIEFETDELTPIAFVTNEDKTTIWWLVIGLIVILSFEIMVGAFLVLKERKKKKEKKAAAVAPVVLLAAVPIGQVIAAIVLGVLVVAFGIADVCLAAYYKRKEKESK